MKKLILALALSLASVASYSAQLTTCNGVTNSDRTILLAINDAKIVQVRVQTNGSLPHVLIAHTASTNAVSTLFTIMGVNDIMEVENTVLALNAGWLRLGSEKFECEAN
jgi:hypothetical protein